MRLLARCVFVLTLLTAAACGTGPSAAPRIAREGVSPVRSPLRAVLVAGDDSIAVFDRATAAMRERLAAAHVAPADILRFSTSRPIARREGTGDASLTNILEAITQLRPRDGQSCLVFATSHGAPGEGLVLATLDEFLTPEALDRALAAGCGEAPTVVIISGCYSGNFAKPPMTRPNRIVLTAAREDRSSFGCGAEFDYTFYDRCLLRAMDETGSWGDAYGSIRTCVATRERALGYQASGPRAFFGGTLARMPLPGR